ncbi:hypothetical protein [Micromonospora sp. NPDC005237]
MQRSPQPGLHRPRELPVTGLDDFMHHLKMIGRSVTMINPAE